MTAVQQRPIKMDQRISSNRPDSHCKLHIASLAQSVALRAVSHPVGERAPNLISSLTGCMSGAATF